MTVSRSRDGIHCILWPPPHLGVASPPFWELEELIAQGFDRDTALSLMATRRAEPCLVSAPAVAPACPECETGTAVSGAPEVSGVPDRKVEAALSDDPTP